MIPLGSIYRLLSKMLANRMRVVLYINDSLCFCGGTLDFGLGSYCKWMPLKSHIPRVICKLGIEKGVWSC